MVLHFNTKIFESDVIEGQLHKTNCSMGMPADTAI